MAEATVTFGAKDINLAATLDKLKKEVGATDSATQKAGKSSEEFGKKSEGGFLKMAAAVATGKAAVELAMGAINKIVGLVTGAFDKFGEAINLGAEMDILSTRTGVASGELTRLGRALDNTGASSEMLGPVFDRMNRAIAEATDGSGAAGKALANLGINVQDLKSLSPDQQFEKIGRALSGVTDFSQRADMALDIFGRGSGTRLLRLFEDYPGAIDQANRQLGLLPQIMSEMSGSFEAISTEMNAARQKAVEFATGILSRMMPAIEAIATGLASIDAAGLGQKLADAFTGGTKAMEGFQSAIDAFKMGELGMAFELIFESIKLQAMQTANEIFRRFTAAFNAAGKFIGDMFDPSGALVKTILDTFTMVAKRISSNIQKDLSDALRGNWMTNSIGEQLAETAERTKKEAAKIEENLVGASGRIAGQFMEAGSALPDSFSESYEKTKPLFDDLTGQQEKIDNIQNEINKKILFGTDARASENKESEGAVRLAEERAAAAEDLAGQEREAKLDLIDLETQLNNAKAEGDEVAAKAIEKELKRLQATAEIKKIAEGLIKDFGVTEEVATGMATRFVESKTAADGVAEALKNSTANAKGLTQELSLSAKLMDSISKAQLKDTIDRGGRLEKRAQAQIAAGQFGAASRTAERIGQSETRAAIREGAGGGIKSMSDIGRKLGLSMKPGETGTEFEGRIAEKMGIEGPPDSLRPSGKQGRTGREAKEEKAQSPLEKLVMQIHDLVKKIEPKLPQQALA